MSSLPTTITTHSLIKNSSSSSRSKNAPTHRKPSAKAVIPRPLSLAPFDDFVLFPNNEAIEHDACNRRKRSERVKRELVADGLLPTTDNDHHGGEAKKLTPLQRAAKRRGVSNHDAMPHCSEEESRRKEMKMPPAPSPPRLDTPDLDDIDEDHWSCCSWDESNVKSYIAARQNKNGTTARNKTL